MTEKTLKQNIQEMRKVADLLTRHTFPKASINHEQDVVLLKQRHVVVDGYDIILCFSKADYGDYFLESIQIQPYFFLYLPFNVVCKIGREFLGQKHISYIEFIKNGRKIYCWTRKSRNGSSVPPEKTTKPGSYEGFEFSIIQPGSVDLF